MGQGARGLIAWEDGSHLHLVQGESSEDEDGAHPQGMLLHLCNLCISPSQKLELLHKTLSIYCVGTCLALMPEQDAVPGAGSCS